MREPAAVDDYERTKGLTMNPFRLNFIPEADRADVEKHRIHEYEETQRAKIREKGETDRAKEQTRRAQEENAGYDFARVLVRLCVAAAIISGAVLGSQWIDAHAVHQAPPPAAAPATSK